MRKNKRIQSCLHQKLRLIAFLDVSSKRFEVQNSQTDISKIVPHQTLVEPFLIYLNFHSNYMKGASHHYRSAKANGRLDITDLDIKYSHLGGLMCQVSCFAYPDLKCNICGKQLQNLCQYVSQLSTEQKYRVIHVLICNSNDHYKDAIKVLVTNKTLPQQDKQEKQQENGEIDNKNQDANTMDLVTLTAMMGTATKTQNASQQENDIQVDFITREQDHIFQPIDIITTDCEQKINDFQQGIVDILTEEITEKHSYTDVLLETFSDTLFIVGTDRSPLNQQHCVMKMQQNDFNNDDYKINKNLNQNEEEDSLSDKDNNIDNDGIEDDYISKQDIQKYQDVQSKNDYPDEEQGIIQEQKCNCDGCKKFYDEYMHELDIFSSVIWQLKMHKQANNADFKILYIFTPKIFDDGVYEGKCIIMPENDKQLNKLLAQLKRNK